jgi:hypothetical protein
MLGVSLLQLGVLGAVLAVVLLAFSLASRRIAQRRKKLHAPASFAVVQEGISRETVSRVVVTGGSGFLGR